MAFSMGSWDWAERRIGKINQEERFELAGQAVGLLSDTVTSLARRILLIKRPKVTPDQILSMQLPRSEASVMAQNLAAEVYTEALHQHCLRTYLWARILAAEDGVVFDDELLYVASLLHDLGLTKSQRKGRSGTACFSVLGARAARLVCSNIWGESRCDKLAHLITMHMNVRVKITEGPEAHLLHEAASLDCTGLRFWEISNATRRQVLQLQPRDEFVDEIRAVFKHECRKFPDGRTTFLHRYLLFGLMVRLCPLRDKRI